MNKPDRAARHAIAIRNRHGSVRHNVIAAIEAGRPDRNLQAVERPHTTEHCPAIRRSGLKCGIVREAARAETAIEHSRILRRVRLELQVADLLHVANECVRVLRDDAELIQCAIERRADRDGSNLITGTENMPMPAGKVRVLRAHHVLALVRAADQGAVGHACPDDGRELALVLDFLDLPRGQMRRRQ